MANLVQVAKDLVEMRKKAKKAQQDLEATIVEYDNGGIKVQFNCAMGMEAISIKPDIIDITRVDKLERLLLDNINKAIKLAQHKALDRMKGEIKAMDFNKMLDE
jgi:DNA-binding protein YbaB